MLLCVVRCLDLRGELLARSSGAPEGGLGVTGEDLHPSQIRGPNNAQISSAKLYASSGN